ncbi:MAG: hypothetical protein J6L88_03415 [Clostridia bacterium]|nr:hypothetical protein [Clostridia bacterium]
MKTILRLLFFWIKVLSVLLIIVAVAGCSFFVAMDITNLMILVKDGMTMRANVKFASEDYDADELTKFFTAEYLTRDDLLNNVVYDQYEIEDYDYDTSVERVWCWPWQDEVTLVIACVQHEMDGELKDEYLTQEQVERGEEVPAPKLENTRYRVYCQRIDDKWTITNLEFMENFADEEPAKEEVSDTQDAA